MKIIIAGNGKIGASLTGLLSDEGHDIVVVDTNTEALDSVMEHYDVMCYCGNCVTQNTLLNAGIMDSDLLIATTNADEVNLLCCAVAHKLNSRVHTIARVRNPEYNDQLFKMREMFALSMSVNPEKSTAKEIERLIKFPGFLKRDTFAKGRVEIVEYNIEQDSILNNIQLKNLENVVKCKVLVCAVLRDGNPIVPDGNFILKENDKIFVTGSAAALVDFLPNLGVEIKKNNNIMICGGGTLSYYLIDELVRDGFHVKVIEQDLKRCEKLSVDFPKIDVINGNACSQELLESEGLKNSDVVVTLTGLDEVNIILSMYASKVGVAQTITKLTHFKESYLFDDSSIGSVICPNDICCNGIVRYVRAMKNHAGAAQAVHFIAENKAQAIEFRVDENYPHCNEKLKSIKLKKNVLISCITHGSLTYIPNGDSEINYGDTIIVVTTNENQIYNFDDIFE